MWEAREGARRSNQTERASAGVVGFSNDGPMEVKVHTTVERCKTEGGLWWASGGDEHSQQVEELEKLCQFFICESRNLSEEALQAAA